MLVVLIGCNSGGPDAKVEDSRIQSAQALRTYFDKAQGNYDSLSDADKAAYIKATGGDAEKAKKFWDQMKYGPGGTPPAKNAKGGSLGSTGAPPPSAGG